MLYVWYWLNVVSCPGLLPVWHIVVLCFVLRRACMLLYILVHVPCINVCRAITTRHDKHMHTIHHTTTRHHMIYDNIHSYYIHINTTTPHVLPMHYNKLQHATHNITYWYKKQHVTQYHDIATYGNIQHHMISHNNTRVQPSTHDTLHAHHSTHGTIQ